MMALAPHGFVTWLNAESVALGEADANGASLTLAGAMRTSCSS
jgi:hypothetical protein